MVDLGTLAFGVRLKDYTDADLEEIKKKLVRQMIRVEAQVGITPDVKKAEKTIDDFFNRKTYKAKVEIDKESMRKIAESLRGHGISSNELRTERAGSIKARTAAYVQSQNALKESRDALAALRKARLEDSKAARAQGESIRGVNSAMSSQSRLAGEVRSLMSNVYSVYTIERFVRGLIEIGGQFEQQKIALGSILRDATKAEVLFGQIKSLSVVSPFQFMDLASYTKQLSAFSIPYEELYDTTKRLADISAGLGVDMSRIILAYGQVRSAAFLRGTELRQFTEAGIPLVQALADKFSILENRVVSAGEVIDKVSRKEVSFGMVQDVLWGMTNEGGQFYNMQEKLADSLYGKWSNLKDQWDILMSDIAQSNNGVLKSGIGAITSLMENWEKVASALTAVVFAYGAYKTAVIATNTIEAIAIVRKYGLIRATEAHTESIMRNVIAQNTLSKGSIALIGRLNSLKAALSGIGKAGWVGITISALAAIGTYLYTAYQNSTKLKRELDGINLSSLTDFQNSIDGYRILVNEIQRVKIKYGELSYKTDEYRSIVDKIQSRYGEYIGNINKEADSYDYLKSKITDVAEALRNKAAEDARQQGMTKIQETYREDFSEGMDSLVDNLKNKLNLSESNARSLAGVLRSKLQEAVDNGLNPRKLDYNSTINQIKSIAKELDIAIDIPQRKSTDIGAGKLYYSGGLTEAVEDIKNIGIAIKNTNDAVNTLNDSQSLLFKNYTIWGIKIDELDKKFEEESKGFSSEEERSKKYIDLLNAKIDVYEQYGQTREANKLKGELETVSKTREEWVGLAEDYANTVTKINQKDIKTVSLLPQEDERESIVKYLKRIAEEYERIKKDIEDLNNVPFPARGESWQESISRANFEKKQYDSLIRSLGVDINNFGKGNKTGSDPVAEMWKKRLDLIDKAIQNYNRWKEVEGRDAAESRAKGSEAYKSLSKSGINVDFQNPEKTYEYVKGKLGLTEKQKELSLSIDVKVDNLSLDNAKKDVEKALTDLQEYIDDQSRKWDLYKQLFAITGNKQESMLAAFQEEVSFNSLIESLRGKMESVIGKSSNATIEMVMGLDEQAIRDTFGKSADEVLKLQKELKKRIEEERITNLVDEAEVIQKYGTMVQKIKALNGKYLEKTGGTVNESGTIDLPDAATEGQIAYFKAYKDELSKITDESIKLLPLWQKLFGDTANMGYRNLVKLVKEAREFADTAKEQKIPATGETEYRLTGRNAKGEEKDMFFSLESYTTLLKQIQKVQDDLYGQNPFKNIIDGFKKLREAENEQEGGEDQGAEKRSDALKMIGVNAGEAAHMISDVADAWAGMFDALGNEDLADTVGLVGDLAGELGSLAEGLTSGNPIQMATSALTFIPNIIGSIAKFHDKKLDKAIQKSALEVTRLKNSYTNLQKSIERQLGEQTKSQTDAMVENLKKQREELEKQKAAEEEKKKSDEGKIEDYKQQIAELDDQLKYFYEDLAKDLYGIDFKDWASKFSDSLMDAWRNGEDAADAFGKTASDILADVANDMVRMAVLEPALNKLRDKISGMMEDGKLDSSELSEIAKGLVDIEGAYEKAYDYLDDLEDRIQKETGGKISIKNPEESIDTLQKGIQGVTEDTANRLASYINSIRQDSSVKRNLLEKLITDTMPKYSILAEAQLAELRMIEKNTRANAAAAAAIMDSLNSVITIGNGGKAIRIK